VADKIHSKDHNQKTEHQGLLDGLIDSQRRSLLRSDSLEQGLKSRFAKLIKLLDYLDISDSDVEALEQSFLSAAAHKKADVDGRPLLDMVAHNLIGPSVAVADHPTKALVSGIVPDFSSAPRNTFRGVRDDGDPIEFLQEHYGVWLQPAKKCLDRPTLKQLDGKLLKAIEQRVARSSGALPSLKAIFASTKEARENQLRFMKTAA